MIKRILILFLLFPALAWGGFSVDGVTDPASVDGVVEPASVDGVTSDYTVSSCPPCYADAGVVWSWDGDEISGHNFACNSSGTALDVFTDAATTGTDYGESGSVGILVDAANAYLHWTQTGSQYANGHAAQTICIRMKIVAGGLADDIEIFKAGNATDQIVMMQLDAVDTRSIDYYYTTAGPDPSAFASSPPLDAWFTRAYSYDQANEKHASNPGDTADPNWGTAWEEDVAELTSDQTNDLIYIDIGNHSEIAPGESDYVYITGVAIVTGYEFDCSTLTGW